MTTKCFPIPRGLSYEELVQKIYERTNLDVERYNFTLHQRRDEDVYIFQPPSIIECDVDLNDCFELFEDIRAIHFYLAITEKAASKIFPRRAPTQDALGEGVEPAYAEDLTLEQDDYFGTCSTQATDRQGFSPLHTEQLNLDMITPPGTTIDVDVVGDGAGGRDVLDAGCADGPSRPESLSEIAVGQSPAHRVDNEFDYFGGRVEGPPVLAPGVVPISQREDGSGMKRGDIFTCKDDFIKIVKLAAVSNCFEVRTVDADSKKQDFRCIDRTCNWRACVRRKDNGTIYELRQYNSIHTCTMWEQDITHKNCTSKFIATCMQDRYDGGPQAPTLQEVVTYATNDLHVPVSKWKAWDARRIATELVYGTPKENYGDIPMYLEMVKATNPGSRTAIHTDEDGQFRYCFIALGACVRGFRYMRPVITVDATFVKTKSRGQVLVAVANDSEKHIFPVAWALVDVECHASWTWFFDRLKEHAVPDQVGLTFVSDRHASIKHAIETVYPSAFHALCYFHLRKNLITHFPRGGWKKMFEKAAYAYTVADFDASFEEMRRTCPHRSGQDQKTICEYLTTDVSVQQWARAHCPTRRYEVMTSNQAESLNNVMRNARKLPPVPMLNHLIVTTSQWFKLYREESMTYNVILTPLREKKFRKRWENATRLKANELGDGVFYVESRKYGSHRVDLQQMSCTCRKWQMTGIPCVHACAAAGQHTARRRVTESTGQFLYDRCSEYYKTYNYQSAYSEVITPVSSREQWDRLSVPEWIRDMPCLPPPHAVTRGRARTTRFPSVGEHVPQRRSYKCSHCGESGHNRKHCPELAGSLVDRM